jgi:hypothetical protein
MARLIFIYQQWWHDCGYCGRRRLVGVTAKHVLACSGCGRW